MIETFEINGHTIEYFDDTHLYLVDGVIIPSVSSILKVKFPDEFKNVPEHVLKNAAIKGTALHESIEIYEKSGQMSDIKEFRNYLFIKKHKGFKNIENEVPVIYEEDGQVLFVGRLDQVIEIDGKLGINDFKRVSAPNKEKIAYQLNLYKLAYEQSYHKKIETLTFTHLREDTRKFVPLPINEDMTKELIREYYRRRAENE